MRQPNTAFTASTTSGRERKLSLRKTRPGSPSLRGTSAYFSYFPRNIVGSARRKR